MKPNLKPLSFLMLACLVLGCGDGGNRVVEQPDPEQLKAKQDEFAEFQRKMSSQSNLPGQR